MNPPHVEKNRALDNGLQIKERKIYYTIRPNFTIDLCAARTTVLKH